jgi:hypothetical protein
MKKCSTEESRPEEKYTLNNKKNFYFPRNSSTKLHSYSP